MTRLAAAGVTVGIPPEGTRLILAAIDVLPQWGTRTDDGMKLTAEWGEPDEHGWYTPTWTVTDDGKVVVDRSAVGIDVERLARALVASDLMRRYWEYAAGQPSRDPALMAPTTPKELADDWAPAIARAYEEASDAEEH